MKYIIAVLAIFILISSSFERRLKRSHKHRNRFHGPTPSQNGVVQFVIAMVKEISNDAKVTDAINSCSPEIEGGASLQEVQQSDTNEKAMSANSETILSNFGDMMVKMIDASCTLKDKIVEVLSKQFRRYVRRFMQGKIKAKFWKWTFAGLWDKIKSTADNVAKDVVKGVEKIGEAVNHAIEWKNKTIQEFEDYVKKCLTEAIEPIVKKVTDWFKDKFNAWLDKHPVLKQLVKFTECFIKKDGVKAIPKVFNVFSGVIKNVVKLFTPTGIIGLIINAICGWRLIQKGFKYLAKANAEKDPVKKTAYRGRATADFLMVAAGETGADIEKLEEY